MVALLHAFFAAAPLAAPARALARGYLLGKVRVLWGSLCGRQASTLAINAVSLAANSNVPVLGYTVPYTVANVLLTLAGPVIVLIV